MRRRTLLATIPAFLGGEARAIDAPPTQETFERAVGGRIGLYAENLSTGAKIAWRADERFAMCSSFKASLVACILARVDRGEEGLDRIIPYGPEAVGDFWAPVAKRNLPRGAMSVAAMCEAAIEYSDNTCANLLLTRIGGPEAQTAFWRSTGDQVTRLDHYEPEMSRSRPPDERDTTSPAAMAGSIRRFVLGRVLAPPSRTLLTRWMSDCQTGKDLLRAGLPHGWKVGDKTGNNGADVLGDIAVAWPKPDRPLVVCVYTQGSSATAPQLRQLLADIGRLVGRQLG